MAGSFDVDLVQKYMIEKLLYGVSSQSKCCTKKSCPVGIRKEQTERGSDVRKTNKSKMDGQYSKGIGVRTHASYSRIDDQLIKHYIEDIIR